MRPHNLALANHLEGIAYYETVLEVDNFSYRSDAYRAAAKLFRDVRYEVLTAFEAKSYKGVGEKISERVEQFALTGTSDRLDELRSMDLERDEVVIDLMLNREITIVRANELYDDGVRSLEDLTDQLTSQELLYLANIQRYSQVIPRQEIYTLEKDIRSKLPANMRVIAVGAYRRGQPATEVDLLVTHTSKAQLQIGHVLRHLDDLFVDTLTEPERAIDSFRGVYNTNRVVNIRLFREEHYPLALFHMTGPYPYVTEMRLHAEQLGLHLNEYRLIQNDSIPLRSERELYYALDMDYVLPSERR